MAIPHSMETVRSAKLLFTQAPAPVKLSTPRDNPATKTGSNRKKVAKAKAANDPGINLPARDIETSLGSVGFEARLQTKAPAVVRPMIVSRTPVTVKNPRSLFSVATRFPRLGDGRDQDMSRTSQSLSNTAMPTAQARDMTVPPNIFANLPRSTFGLLDGLATLVGLSALLDGLATLGGLSAFTGGVVRSCLHPALQISSNSGTDFDISSKLRGPTELPMVSNNLDSISALRGLLKSKPLIIC